MYTILGEFDGDLIIYRDNSFFLKVIRWQSFGLKKSVKIFDNKDQLILNYDYYELIFTKVRIKIQNLPLKVKLVRKNLINYNLMVDNTVVSLKFSLTSLSKKICDIYLDNRKIGTVVRKVFVLRNEIEILMEEDSKYELYIILLIVISTTTLDS